MGLAAYIERVDKEAIQDDQVVDFQIDRSRWDSKEVMYWRKFSDLHGWMNKKYVEFGGKYPDFNGPSIIITKDLLIQLKNDIKSESVEKTVGFFYGEMTQEKWYTLEEDIDSLLLMLENNPHHKFYYFASY